MEMWTRLLITLSLSLMLAYEALAAVQIYYPVSGSAGGGSSVYIGQVSPGSTVTIITDRGPQSDPWSKVITTPASWAGGYFVQGNRLYIEVNVPKTASGAKTVCFQLLGKQSSESFCAALLITTGLMEFNVPEKTVSVGAGETARIPFLVINRGAGSYSVRIISSLPKPFFTETIVRMDPFSAKTGQVTMKFPFPGEYRVILTARNEGDGEQKSSEIALFVYPTISSDFRLVQWGFPFSNPLLWPIMTVLGAAG